MTATEVFRSAVTATDCTDEAGPCFVPRKFVCGDTFCALWPIILDSDMKFHVDPGRLNEVNVFFRCPFVSLGDVQYIHPGVHFVSFEPPNSSCKITLPAGFVATDTKKLVSDMATGFTVKKHSVELGGFL